MDVTQSWEIGRAVKETTRNNTEANWGTQKRKKFGNVEAAHKDILTSSIIKAVM